MFPRKNRIFTLHLIYLDFFYQFLSRFLSIFIVMTHKSTINFKFIYFLVWIKGSHQSSNFETFECSVKNLPNSSCHFPNHKSIFLRILNHSSVPWKIIPLYFFSSKIIFFGQKQPIKVQIFEIFECSGHNPSNCSCQCWIDKPIPLQILHHSSLSWNITPL